MPLSEEIYLTHEGAARLRAELELLTGSKRQELAKRLKKAIQNGDLSENADYIAAKEEQGFLEGRIQEIEYLLRNSIIVESPPEKPETVNIGNQVTVQLDDSPPVTYHLVGKNEANPRQGRISYESPIGQALIGKRVGQTAIADTPGGLIKLKILSIS
jgi:transcription elongation factor GreA